MAVNAGDIIRATFTMTGPSNQVAQNVYHYLAGPGVTITDSAAITAVRNQLDAAYTEINSMLSDEWSFGTVAVQVSYDGGLTFNDIGSTPSLATDPSFAGDPVPSGVACVVLFGGTGTGRQGRKFIAGIAEAGVDDDNITAPNLALLFNYAADIVTDIGVAGGQLVAGWYSEAANTFRDYNSSIITNAVVGYQRRRKPGVGI